MGYIGIDPGGKGYMTWLRDDGGIEYFPLSGSHPLEWSTWLEGVRDAGEVHAVMEEVHAIYGSSAKGTFSFGEVFGLLKGLLIALKIPYVLVPPKRWQGDVWVNDDRVMEGGKVDTKRTSINAAWRLYPAEDLRRSEKCRNVDDNKVDSLLIATYARRHNL